VYFQHNDLLTSVSADILEFVSLFLSGQRLFIFLSKIKTFELGILFPFYRKYRKIFIHASPRWAFPSLMWPLQENYDEALKKVALGRELTIAQIT